MKGGILIVDDDKAVREAICEYMKKIEYDVYPAISGEDGLIMMEKGKNYIHLVIADFKMPSMNGLEFFAKLNESKIDVEKILITGHADSDIAKQAKDLGVKESISKPFSFEFLGKTINKLLTEKAFAKIKKHILRKLPISSLIEIIHRKTQDIKDYSSGSEYLLCRLNEVDVAAISLFLRHLEVRHGMCISVSRGCPKNCPKCFSGTMCEFLGHFTFDEILAMIIIILKESFYYNKEFWLYKLPFFVATMGSGDIAFNFEATISAMEKLFKVFGERFVCNISTAFEPGIKQLTDYVENEIETKSRPLVPNLQVSFDSLKLERRRLTIDSDEDPDLLIAAALRYHEISKIMITANFVMCDGINNIPEETSLILEKLDPKKFKLKLSTAILPEKSGLVPASKESIEAIEEILVKNGYYVEVFDEEKQMGFSTGGSCGTIVHGI